jgi:hypothetical protein
MAIDSTSTTYTGQKKTDTLDSRVRLEEGNRRLIVSDGTNNVALFGYDAAGNIVVKVAKAGYNADTATNDQLVFNSSQNTFKIAYTGSLTLNSRGAATGAVPDTVSYTHNLGYTPAVTAFISYGSTYLPLPFTLYNLTTGAIRCRLYTQVDSSTVTFIYQEWSGTEGVTAFPIKFYLLQETAS